MMENIHPTEKKDQKTEYFLVDEINIKMMKLKEDLLNMIGIIRIKKIYG